MGFEKYLMETNIDKLSIIKKVFLSTPCPKLFLSYIVEDVKVLCVDF